MPRSEKTAAARAVVSEASAALTLDLVEDLAEPLAEFMVANYDADDWQSSPLVESLAGVAALLERDEREVPACILEALKKAAEAGQPVGVA